MGDAPDDLPRYTLRADELQRHLAERLVKYKIPGELRIVDRLPLASERVTAPTATGSE